MTADALVSAEAQTVTGPGLRRGAVFVGSVDARLFCLRHRVGWGVRGLLVRVGAAVLATAVLAPPVAVLVGYLVGGWSAAGGLSSDALAGAVLGVLALQALGRLLGGASRGTRVGVFAPPDGPVLRAFDVPLSAVLLVRVAAPTVLRQLLIATVAVGTLTGLHVAGGGGPPGPALLAGAALPVGAAAGACVLAGMSPPVRPRGAVWWLLTGPLALGCGVAAGVGAGAAVPATPTGPLSEAQQIAVLDGAGRAVHAAVGGYGPPVLVVALAVIAVLARWRRDPARWVPALRRSAVGGPRGRDAVRPLLVVALMMLRSGQGAAVAFRRAGGLVVHLGLVLLALGATAPGIVLRWESALPGDGLPGDGLPGHGTASLLAGSGGGLLLVVAVLAAAFVGSIAGPQVLAGPLRWRREQGASPWDLGTSHLLGMLLVIAPPVVLWGAALALLFADATLLGYAACIAVAACASSALGDLVTAGRQANPDGTADAGVQGAVLGLLALVAAQLPWLWWPASAIVLGPLAAATLFVGTVALFIRRIES